jgi:hypothetical protein
MSGQEGRVREMYQGIVKAGGKFAHLAQRQLEKLEASITTQRWPTHTTKKGERHAPA